MGTGSGNALINGSWWGSRPCALRAEFREICLGSECVYTYIRRSRLPAHAVKIELGDREPEVQELWRPNEDTSSTAEEMQIDGQSFQGKYLSLYVNFIRKFSELHRHEGGVQLLPYIPIALRTKAALCC